jgi:hypothetical protein
LKSFKIFAALAFAFAFPLNAVPAYAVVDAPCDTYSWTREDDAAHQMILPFSLPLGDTTYDITYVTTNGTLTFGTPDANFSSYPNTPSISLAGYDWVTFGEGTSLSYGVNNTGFCVLWKVRPYPQSTGAITEIKLTVDIARYPSWSGTVETTGWLPADLRRGIRFAPNTDVVTISEAFTVNGGLPVEMQSCWDGSVIPLTSTCPPEPPPGQCWDGSTVAWNETCPPVPPDTQCWDGSWITWSQTCPQQPPPLECWDGTSVSWDAQCPPTPPDITCWDGSVIMWNQTCPVEPSPTPTPEPTVTPTPEPTPSLEPTPSPEPTPEPTPSPSETLTPEPTPEVVVPTPVETQTPEPEPTASVEPPLDPEPTPIPEPTQSESPFPEPTIEPTITSAEETTELVSEALSDGSISAADTADVIDAFLSDGEITEEELTNLFDTFDPTVVLTEDEKEFLSDVLVAAYEDTAIPADVFEESGLDYEDLPPDQPITLENGVVLLAEIADAIEIFEDPAELLATVFTDPEKALKAISNVGADLPKEIRKTAQQGTVAVVLVGQVIVGGVTTSLARR